MSVRALTPLLLAVALLLATAAGPARGAGLPDEAGAEWQVEQPAPPPPPSGVEPSSTPIGLGRIGDIEFWEPNRGALITAGNGTSVPAGVWFYDGLRWRELATQCGASDGRIAWAGPDEFWTISDGRAGQAVSPGGERPPLEDNTLCHFAPGPSGRLEIVASYASQAFLASSYPPMHAAGCITPVDCWFAGEPLEAPQTGAFQLHWNGNKVEAEPFLPEGHTVLDLTPFEGRLYESVRLLAADRVVKAQLHPPPLRKINPAGSSKVFESVSELPLYSEGEFATALDYLHLSAGGETLWAAAGPQLSTPQGSEAAGVTVIRKHAGGGWSELLGPESSPTGAQLFPEAVLDSIAAEPGGQDAWLALDTIADAAHPGALETAHIARVAADGTISDEARLPAPGDPHGPLGAAHQIVCPAEHDCWMTTGDGWLVHLANAEERANPTPETDPVFGAEEPITFRPHDEGVPQEPSDEIPADVSGLEQEKRLEEVIKPAGKEPVQVPVPLLSHLRSRVVHRSTLELRFHLAVKARVRLLAERSRRVVARTRQQTLGAGNRTLRLRLDPKRWPTKLNLQTHALAPLPTRTTGSPNVNSVSTSFVAPARLLSEAGTIP
jgi:hypothetical protein